MGNIGWITNSPAAANKLKAADRAYAAALRRCAAMKLSDKIIAIAAAHNTRHAAYEALRASIAT